MRPRRPRSYGKGRGSERLRFYLAFLVTARLGRSAVKQRRSMMENYLTGYPVLRKILIKQASLF
jgi:hypothetical protein